MTIREVFERHIVRTDGNGGCWIWEGNVSNNGYGRVTLLGVNFLAHRVSYELYMGLISEDKGVLHKCGNKLCVNPEHLYLGDAQDNARDWVELRKIDGESELTFTDKRTRTMDVFERNIIVEALTANMNNRAKTAVILGMSTTTLWRKMKKYCIV